MRTGKYMIDRREILKAGGAIIGVLGAQELCACGIAGHAVSKGMVNVDDHGASVDASPQANLAAFRAAIAATPGGGRLIVPNHAGATYRLDTSGGMRTALVIDRPITLQIDGRVQATKGVSGSNPPFLFRVTASGVTFLGKGWLLGSGDVDDSNNKDDRSYAGLVHVTGDRFRFVGLTVSKVPKVGIQLWNCRGATISARWVGGIGTYVHGRTGLFAIRATGGGQHNIVHNRFERDAAGRRMVTAYFAGGLLGGTNGDTIAYNYADVHEKLAYLYTDNSTIANCTIVNALQTDVIRIVGGGNVVDSIHGTRIKGGVTIYNGMNNIIRNCKFMDVDQEGVVVSFTNGYTKGLGRTIITNNIIAGSGDSRGLQDGICVYVGDGYNDGVEISGNSVSSSGAAVWKNCIRIEAIPPFHIKGSLLRQNVTSGGVNGISVRRLSGGRFAGNKVGKLHGGEGLLQITS